MKKLAFTLAAVCIILAGCMAEKPYTAPRHVPEPAVQAATPDPNRSGAATPGGTVSELVTLAEQAWENNNDAVGWLRVPGTAIDDAVFRRYGDNSYYLRRGADRRYSFGGVYYADGLAGFGNGSAEGLGRNTVIYGHSMSDSKNDAKFGPIRFYFEEDFARENPVIYFSTLRDELAWEVIAIFYTHIDMPYNTPGNDEALFAGVVEEAMRKSILDFGYSYSSDDKFLTLSTCVYSLPDSGAISYPNDYRLALMARLLPEGEKPRAQVKRNLNILQDR
ncbi:MAG: class B sortase [Oscillospiraceae bacterium]|nr:class B sortase [Oscillospiraceae bacterium]